MPARASYYPARRMSRPSRFSADCTRRLRFAVDARPWLAFAVFAAVLVIPLVTFVGLDRPVWADEVGYFATVRYFGDHFRFATLADYDQVTPPLAYFVYAAWGKVVGFDLSSLRILSLVLAVSTFALPFGLNHDLHHVRSPLRCSSRARALEPLGAGESSHPRLLPGVGVVRTLPGAAVVRLSTWSPRRDRGIRAPCDEGRIMSTRLRHGDAV